MNAEQPYMIAVSDVYRKHAVDSLLKALGEGPIEYSEGDPIKEYLEAWRKFEPQLRDKDSLEAELEPTGEGSLPLLLIINLVYGDSQQRKVRVFDSDDEPKVQFKNLYDWE